MSKENIFISCECGYSGHSCDLINGWTKNSKYGFICRKVLTCDIHTNDISSIKVALANKIDNAAYVLILINDFTHLIHPDKEMIGYKNWQNWDILKAKEYGKNCWCKGSWFAELTVKRPEAYNFPT